MWARLSGEGGAKGWLRTCDKNTRANTPTYMRAQAGTFTSTHDVGAKPHIKKD